MRKSHKKALNIRPIWIDSKSKKIQIIDQRFLPHKFVIKDLNTINDVVFAIKEMCVRGAPLIGVVAAFGVYLGLMQKKTASKKDIMIICNNLKNARPTAMNLFWAVDRVLLSIKKHNTHKAKTKAALKEALKIMHEEIDSCKKIGEHGMSLIKKISKKKKGAPVNILTHCNAGWLACIEHGTATAPIYRAFENKIDVHVWVDETRPLNQGSFLTAWELGQCKIKHTIITDNAGGHLMQHGMVDIVIVGTDRTTRTGDAANKIGTYLKALAAKDNNVPFYVALPLSTFDKNITNGVKSIPIEERNPDEIKYIKGFCNTDSKIKKVLVVPKKSNALNHAFDVTPARLITGFITQRGICKANEKSILSLFPEMKT